MHNRTAWVVLLLAAVASLSSAQSSGRFHLVRSTSGSKGAPEGNRFVFEDSRVVFQAGKDRQVLVLFEWQGPLGRHRCEGTWKDPAGRPVFTSEAEVLARGPRFSVYWGLSLPDSVATGTWVLEARVDGEPAGAHAFQIVAEVGAAAPTPHALSIAGLYELGLATTLTLQVLDASGARVGTTSGFFVSSDLASTSLTGINAARAVRLLRQGKPLDTSSVVSWNRRHDWAALRFANATGSPAERAATAPKVGDRCFFLDAQADGGRIIVETSIVGASADGDLTLADTASEASYGAPVLNEYGEVVAALAGSGVLGATALDMLGVNDMRTMVQTRGTRARMLAPVPDPTATVRSLEELDRAGLFVRPLARTPHFVNGILGTGVGRQGDIPVATDQRFRFSRNDGQCVVFVTWTPALKEDTTSSFQLFDEENRKIAATELKKARLRPGQSFVESWQLALRALQPGLYRVDVLIGPDPVWRTFFRVTD